MINQYRLRLTGKNKASVICSLETETPAISKASMFSEIKQKTTTTSLTRERSEKRMPNQPEIRKNKLTPQINKGAMAKWKGVILSVEENP